MKKAKEQERAAGADTFSSAGWESGATHGTMRKVPGRSARWGADWSRSGDASDSGPSRLAMAVFLSGLLLLNPACSAVGPAAESAPDAVASGSPSITDLVKKDIKRGDEVTVTEKNGTVHRLKVSKIDDEGIHGRDSRKKQVTIPFDDFHSLAVQRGVIRDSNDYRDGSGEGYWGVPAGNVVVGTAVGAGVGYLLLRGAVHSIGEAAGAALGGMGP